MDRFLFWLNLSMGLSNIVTAIFVHSFINLGLGLLCLVAAFVRRPDSWRSAR